MRCNIPSFNVLTSLKIEISEKGSFPPENISHIKTPKLQTSDNEVLVSISNWKKILNQIIKELEGKCLT